MKKVDYPRLQECCYEAVLENGLTVRVLPKPDFDRFYAVLAVNYGALDTEYLQNGTLVRTPAGVAHYLEHKMFDLPDGSAMQGFTRYGGNPNAFTGYEMTAYYVQSTEHAEENLRLLLEMVMTPYFTEESVEKERGIISEEIRMYADNADTQVYEQLFAAMFPEHPAAVPIAGTVESIQDISAGTLQQCYEAFYQPCNMILCVAGKLAPQTVLEIAEACTPKEKTICAEKIEREAALSLQRPKILQRMEVSMPNFTVGIRLQDLQTGDAVTELAADLAAELVVGEASDCYRELYEQGLIDTGFFSGFESLRQLALFSFGGDSEEPETVQQAVLDSAKRLLEQGIDAAELQRLKRSMLGRRLRELDSFGGTCNRICGYFFDGLDYLGFREVFDAVGENEIRQILTQLTSENACISVIEPKN